MRWGWGWGQEVAGLKEASWAHQGLNLLHVSIRGPFSVPRAGWDG